MRTVRTVEETLQRYPRVCALLVCESGETFSAYGAGKAVLYDRMQLGLPCPWYIHEAHSNVDTRLMLIGRGVLARAIQRRHEHRNTTMYSRARVFIAAEKLAQLNERHLEKQQCR